MKVTIIPIVNRALGKVTLGLIRRQEGLKMRGRVERIQTTALLRSARILRRVLETGDWRRLAVTPTPMKAPSADADVKNSIMIIIQLQPED